MQKLAVYGRASVRHVWLVDPTARTLEILRLEQGRWTIATTAAGAAILRPEPFDALDLDLTRLWADAPPHE